MKQIDQDQEVMWKVDDRKMAQDHVHLQLAEGREKKASDNLFHQLNPGTLADGKAVTITATSEVPKGMEERRAIHEIRIGLLAAHELTNLATEDPAQTTQILKAIARLCLTDTLHITDYVRKTRNPYEEAGYIDTHCIFTNHKGTVQVLIATKADIRIGDAELWVNDNKIPASTLQNYKSLANASEEERKADGYMPLLPSRIIALTGFDIDLLAPEGYTSSDEFEDFGDEYTIFYVDPPTISFADLLEKLTGTLDFTA